MILAAIAINRPMPLPGASEKNLCTVICMYVPERDLEKNESENPETAHYQHLHFDSWENLCEWLVTAKLGSRLTTVH
jgi:hypothetical protein